MEDFWTITAGVSTILGWGGTAIVALAIAFIAIAIGFELNLFSQPSSGRGGM